MPASARPLGSKGILDYMKQADKWKYLVQNGHTNGKNCAYKQANKLKCFSMQSGQTNGNVRDKQTKYKVQNIDVGYTKVLVY